MAAGCLDVHMPPLIICHKYCNGTMRLRKFIGGVLGDVGKARQQPAIVIKLTLPKIDFFFFFLAKILLFCLNFDFLATRNCCHDDAYR